MDLSTEFHIKMSAFIVYHIHWIKPVHIPATYSNINRTLLWYHS